MPRYKSFATKAITESGGGGGNRMRRRRTSPRAGAALPAGGGPRPRPVKRREPLATLSALQESFSQAGTRAVFARLEVEYHEVRAQELAGFCSPRAMLVQPSAKTVGNAHVPFAATALENICRDHS